MIISDTIRLYDDEDFSEDYPTSKVLEAVAYTFSIDSARLRAIAEAEKDGRLMVLPCKVDTLRRSIDANVSEEVCLVEAEGLSRHGNCKLTCFDCYVNALAKAEAEAEAALSAGKGE